MQNNTFRINYQDEAKIVNLTAIQQAFKNNLILETLIQTSELERTYHFSLNYALQNLKTENMI